MQYTSFSPPGQGENDSTSPPAAGIFFDEFRTLPAVEFTP